MLPFSFNPMPLYVGTSLQCIHTVKRYNVAPSKHFSCLCSGKGSQICLSSATGVLSLHAWCSFCTEACGFSQMFPGIDLHVGKARHVHADVLPNASMSALLCIWDVTKHWHSDELAPGVVTVKQHGIFDDPQSVMLPLQLIRHGHSRYTQVELPVSFCQRADVGIGAY